MSDDIPIHLPDSLWPKAPWSDPTYDVMADFKRFAESNFPPLQPWQEDMIEAVLSGKSLMVVAPRSAGRTAASEAWRKYSGAKPVKGCHTPRAVVDEWRDELPHWYGVHPDVEQDRRDRRWAAQWLGQWTDEGRVHEPTGWRIPPDLPEPDPALDTLDLCVQPFARR